jgi:hypothetical protein
LGLAKVLARLRNDVTYPGDPGELIHGRQRAPCVIASPRTLDRNWIPIVASQGWLIITRDRRIQDHRLEVASVLEHSARMVALSSAEAGTKWAQLEVVMSRWREIEALLEQPGPFIYTATRSQLAEVDLETLRRH